MTTVSVGTNIGLFDPKVLPPFPRGLYEFVDWVQDGGEARFIREDGLVIRPQNFPSADEYGTLVQEFCEQPAEPLIADRPDIDDLDVWSHASVWYSSQNQCLDLRPEGQQEARDRVLGNFLRLEPLGTETAFATRLLALAGAPVAATNLKDAIGQLTDAAAALGVGEVYIHARPYWAVQEYGLFTSDMKTVLGAQLVVGGGYVNVLGNVLVATTPVYGWRSEQLVTESLEPKENLLYSLAQRSVLLGVEKIIAAVEIATP